MKVRVVTAYALVLALAASAAMMAEAARADEPAAPGDATPREVLGRPGQRGHWRLQTTPDSVTVTRNDQPVWTGNAALRGDLGERMRDGVRIRRDGRYEYFVFGKERDGVRICGEDRSTFSERAIDGEPLTFENLFEPNAVAVAALPPGYDLGAPSGALSWTSSSGAFGSDDPLSAHRLDPRFARVRDGQAWISERGAESRVFWTGSWRRDAGSLEVLAFSFAGEAERRAGSTLVRIVGDGGEAVVARLPVPADGSRVFVRLEPARAWACVSVQFLEPTLRDGRVAVAGVEGYGPLDRADGRHEAFDRVAEGGRDASSLAEALVALGPRVIGLVSAEFPRASVRGRARLLSIAEAFPNEPDSIALALSAFGDEDDVNEAALKVLAANSTQAGEDAILALIESRPADAPKFVGLLARKNFSRSLLWLRTRSDLWTLELLRAVFVALGDPSRHPTAFSSLVEEPDFSNAARSKLCAVLAELHISRPAMRCVEMAVDAMRTEDSFESRYRFARALRVIAPSTAVVDDWLKRETENSNWILRREAFRSLARRGTLDAERRERFRTDESPRVRVAFYSENVLSTTELAAVIDGLEGERWPIVRVAEIRAIGRLHDTSAEIEGALTRSIDDTSPLVRRAAIEVVLRRPNDAGREAVVLARLADEREDVTVVDAAIDFVEGKCVLAAADRLEARVRRVFRPDAPEDDALVATRALRAMLAFGGEPARAASLLAAREGAPASWPRLVAANFSPACAQPAPAR
jgi:hypothetical protein